jgi:hypothetical protein
MIKKIASGGDPLEARKNYKDECKFTIDTKLIFITKGRFLSVSPQNYRVINSLNLHSKVGPVNKLFF